MKKYQKEIREAPPVPFQGLTIDKPIDGGFVKAKNVDFINGDAVRRKPHRYITGGTTIMASRGYKSMYEFRKSDESKYQLIDVDYDDSGDKMKVIGSSNVSTSDEITMSTWTTPIDGLITGKTVVPRYATGQDMAIRVDGTNDNLIFRDLTTPETCGVEAPATAPTIAQTTGGDMLEGQDYYVYYTYVKKVGDYEVESYPSPKSLVLNLGTGMNAINVTYVGSTDTAVTHIRIYRNLAGTMENFFKGIDDLTNGDNTSKLIKSDDDLSAAVVMSLDAGQPPKAIDTTYAATRMWYLTKDKLMYSNSAEPESVPSLNYIHFDLRDGNDLVGIGALRDSLIVFKRNKTWNVSLYTPFARDVVSRNLGCIDKRTIASTGSLNSLIWMSEEGVMYYDGGEISNISENKINSEFEVFKKNGAEFHGRYDPSKQQYHLIMFYRNADETLIEGYKHFVYNMSAGSNTWSEYEYRNDDDEIIYSTAISSCTDANGLEVMVTGSLTGGTGTGGTDGVLGWLIQSFYDRGLIPLDGYRGERFKISDDTFKVIQVDSNGYVYSTVQNGDIRKTDIYGNTEVLWSHNPDINTYSYYGNSMADMFDYMLLDKNTGYIYMGWFSYYQGYDANRGDYRLEILRMDINGGDKAVIYSELFDINTSVSTPFLAVDSHGSLFLLTGSLQWNATDEQWQSESSTIYKCLTPRDGSLATTPPAFGVYQEITDKNIILGYDRQPHGDTKRKICVDKNDNMLFVACEGAFSSDNIFRTDGQKRPWDGSWNYVNEEYIVCVLPEITSETSNGITQALITSTPVACPVSYDNINEIYYILANGDSSNERGDLYKLIYTSSWSNNKVSTTPNVHLEEYVYNIYFDDWGKLIVDYDAGEGKLFRLWNNNSPIEDQNFFQIHTADENNYHVYNACSYPFYPYWLYCSTVDGLYITREIDKEWSDDGSGGTSGIEDSILSILEQFRNYTLNQEGKDMDYDGVVVELVSTRSDYNLSHKTKLFHRLYFDTLSERTTAGVLYIEGDSTIRQYVHSDDETTTPNRAISGGGFASPGWEEWKTEYHTGDGNMFDSEVDNIDTHKLHINVKGSNFRWSMKMGDVTNGVKSGDGKWVMKPPRLVFILQNMIGQQEN